MKISSLLFKGPIDIQKVPMEPGECLMKLKIMAAIAEDTEPGR
jgi:hypothetical protein